MLYDKLSLFADGLVVPTTANTTTYSKVIDLRKSTFIDPLLKIYGQIVGTVNATGSVTTKVQVSDNGYEWTDYVSFTQDGMYLIRTVMPIVNKKRFMRLAFVVGGTALGSAVAVKCGLVDQFDMSEIEGLLPSIQTYPPLEDLATDAFAEEVVIVATATITKGSNAVLTPTKGFITGWTAPTNKYTITRSGTGIKIALAADAADGNVTVVDGLGKVHTIAVTAQAAA